MEKYEGTLSENLSIEQFKNLLDVNLLDRGLNFETTRVFQFIATEKFNIFISKSKHYEIIDENGISLSSIIFGGYIKNIDGKISIEFSEYYEGEPNKILKEAVKQKIEEYINKKSKLDSENKL